jgi:MOSC domain-containing protein YiiM
MKARANSTQLKAIVKANNERWEASKNGVSIRVYEDGTVSYGDGSPMTWAEAHKLVTDGRKHFQAERRDRNGAKKSERAAAKRAKLEAKLAGINAALAALSDTTPEGATATA